MRGRGAGDYREDKAMSDALAVRQDTTPAVVSPMTMDIGAILSLAKDPNISLERVEQTFSFYQRIQADLARKSFDASFAAMQAEMPVIEKEGHGHNGKYGRWEDIVDQIKPVTSKYGFGISFKVSNEPNKITVRAILSHRDGHREETAFDLPADTSGGKNAIQAIGSSTSYGKRYTASALLNIVTRGEDDDGNGGPKQRKSSSAAKKDGTTERFNKIKQDFEAATSVEHLMSLKRHHWEEVETLPARWYELLEDTYSLMFDELKGAEQARSS
jgi:hypothetical protein